MAAFELPSAEKLPESWWQAETAPRRMGALASGGLSFPSLVAFTIVLVLAPQSLSPALASLRIALLAALLAIGAHVSDSLQGRAPLLRATLTNVLALLLLLWAIVTAPLSYWPGGSVALLFGLYLKALAVFWLLGAVVNRGDRLRVLCAFLAVLVLPLSLTAVWNYATGAFVPGGVIHRIAGYDAPLTRNPNDLALMLNLVLPLTIALLFDSRRGWIRVGLSGLIALSAVAIVLTFSRGGFLCLACTAATYFGALALRGKIGWTAAGVGGLALAVLLMPSGYAARLSTISDVNSDPTLSAQLRWADMQLAASYIADNPLMGAGIGMNTLALNELRGPAWKEVHNAYLQYGVDLGVPGLVLFSGLLVSCLRDVLIVEKRCRTLPERRGLALLAEGLRTSLIAFALAAFFHPVAYEFYFFYVGGLAVAARRICETECPA